MTAYIALPSPSAKGTPEGFRQQSFVSNLLKFEAGTVLSERPARPFGEIKFHFSDQFRKLSGNRVGVRERSGCDKARTIEPGAMFELYFRRNNRGANSAKEIVRARRMLESATSLR
ncbi:MAG: hypothetical protein JNN22_09800 [Rhodospirillales bacterium]|nr:hypothetical protein [Rhodospirillales bacterium]